MSRAGSAGHGHRPMHFFLTPRTLLVTELLLAMASLHPAGSLAQTESTEPPSRPLVVPEEAPTLEEVVVTGQTGPQGPAYAAQESRTATKTRTLLLETLA
jgi:hypothetical protein